MQMADRHDVDEAAQILHHLRRGDFEKKAEAIKQAGLFVLERTYFPEAVPLLMELLEQEATPKLAEEAAWALWKFKDPRAIPVLLKKAQEAKHISVREKAIRALGLMEVQEALPYLCQMVSVNSQEPLFLQAAAISALGHFDDTRLISKMEKLLERNHPLLRKEALCSMGRFLRRDPHCLNNSTLKKIRGFIFTKKAKSEGVRGEALKTFSYSRDPDSRKLVEKALLKDPSPEVRKAALALLSQWNDEGTENLLFKALEDLSWAVRYAAAEALVQAAKEKKVFNHPRFLIALQKISKTLPSHIKARETARKAAATFCQIE